MYDRMFRLSPKRVVCSGREPTVNFFKALDGRTVVDIRTPITVSPYVSRQILSEYLTQFDGGQLINRAVLVDAIKHPDTYRNICVCMNGQEVTWVDGEFTGGPE